MTKWPDIPYSRWQPSGASLHMWTQIVGKFRLAQTPWINHSWQATFYVSGRGLNSSLIPGEGCSYDITFDFIDHQLKIDTTDGRQQAFALEPMSVAAFHERFLTALSKLGAPSDIHHAPNEVPDPVPFREQTGPGAYDRDAVWDFWQALVAVDAVFKRFRTGFLGKVSPVHFFWGSFDLAVTRFSGRPAPLHPGGFPALPDTVTREAYSHEVSSAGFWPGGGGIDYPAFYSYAYPMPDGFGDRAAEPTEAFFQKNLGEYVLPYDAVRQAADPEAALMSFLQTTYRTAADLAQWEREKLEADLGVPRVPRRID
ncbi:hypothetical protein HBA54_18320 [Pelagibius litoralis]|uniref:Ava_C0101 and related proteins n=1 Tax=Pelagibius litoralis TaxID=374515 RepID=A0A967F036_9PROT|nr:DUF5996 family protein [Pelagibius litoralis]NIA70555.1 hypothetical protein [Pelagibius litoralis]